MSGFDPGPGWREVKDNIPADPGGEVVMWYEAIDGGPIRRWFREGSAVRLPTVPYTVIRATSGTEPGVIGQVLTLVPDDHEWPWQNYRDGWRGNQITGFEVLAEPRAVTAKAVLERVRERSNARWLADMTEPLDEIARDFGVGE